LLPSDSTIQLSVVEVSNVGGSQVTLQIGMSIVRIIREALEEDRFDGFVVTQGTDSIEEISYLVDTLIETELPIVNTGAMRSHSVLGSDAVSNLYAAIQVASSEDARNHGVLVVMNDYIYAASEVVKTDTVNPNTFAAPGRGPLGVVTRHKPVFFHRCLTRVHIPARELNELVPCIRICLGMDGTLISGAIQSGAQGLILEGNGAGNIAETSFTAIQEAVGKGIPVVLSSSCYSGLVDDIYGYQGGGYTLRQLGVIFAQGLTAPKARIKLMAALSAKYTRNEIKDAFEYLI
jgi:L-asparaginase